jgi:mono/diheme cytochrome c family protein
MRALKVIGKGLAGLVAFLVVAIGALYAQTQWKMSQKGVPPSRARLVVPADTALVSRGARLIVADGCTDCHKADLGGGVMVDDALVGRLVASNLTTGGGGVAARYDDGALDIAIRDGVGWDGRKLIFMPSHEFAGLADNDVAAIITYLRSVPPVSRMLPANRIGPAARGLMAAGKLVILPNDLVDHGRTTLAVAPSGGTLDQGRYISAGCTGCHGKDFGGGPIPGAPPSAMPSANLTPSGRLATWSDADFLKAMREGKRPDGTRIDESMPWKAMGRMTDEELQSVFRYLKSVPPKAADSQ